ncbi:MAG: MlaD family protein [Myxococcota bacterium]|nr:MlaD family protein [Myxococcota bacterium]
MKTLLLVTLAGSLFAMVCAGQAQPSITVNLSSADGLAVGQPVQLNGIDLGEVSAVGFPGGP